MAVSFSTQIQASASDEPVYPAARSYGVSLFGQLLVHTNSHSVAPNGRSTMKLAGWHLAALMM